MKTSTISIKPFLLLLVGLCIADISFSRELANFVPREDVQAVLLRPKGLYHNITMEDDRGILRGMKDQFAQWNEQQAYVEKWNLEGFANYNVVDTNEKKAYLNRMIIKYLDKRISGEIKKADEGTTLHRIGQVQQALKPSATVEISSGVKARFKARILEGEATLSLENPWLDARSEFNKDGEVKVIFDKNYEEYGISYSTNYFPLENNYVTTISKKITAELVANLSTAQTDSQMMFSDAANKTLSFNYNKSF